MHEWFGEFSPVNLGAPASRRRVALKGKILAAETAALPGSGVNARIVSENSRDEPSRRRTHQTVGALFRLSPTG